MGCEESKTTENDEETMRQINDDFQLTLQNNKTEEEKVKPLVTPRLHKSLGNKKWNNEKDKIYETLSSEIKKVKRNISIVLISTILLTKEPYDKFEFSSNSFFKIIDKENDWYKDSLMNFRLTLEVFKETNEFASKMLFLDYTNKLKEYEVFTYCLRLRNIINDFSLEFSHKEGSYSIISLFHHTKGEEMSVVKDFLDKMNKTEQLVTFIPILINKENIDEKEIKDKISLSSVYAVDKHDNKNDFYKRLNIGNLNKGIFIFVDKIGIIQDISNLNNLSFESVMNFITNKQNFKYSNLKKECERIVNELNKDENNWNNSSNLIGKIKKIRIFNVYDNNFLVSYYHKFKFTARPSDLNYSLYNNINNHLTQLDSSFNISLNEDKDYEKSNKNILNNFILLMKKLNFTCLDFNLEYTIKRKYDKNKSFRQTKSSHCDIQVKLNASSCEYDKTLLYNEVKAIIFKNSFSLPNVNFINFIHDYFEKFDDKYTKPKIVVLFYTSTDDDRMKLFKKLIKQLTNVLEDEENEFENKFHEIYFRKMDSLDCSNQESNQLDVPDCIQEKKIIKLPKKLSKIQFQDLFDEFYLFLTNTKNEVIYIGPGVELNLKETFNSILNNSNKVIFEDGFPINKQRMKALKHKVNEFIKLLESKFKNYTFYYEPFIEFAYKKIYDYDNMALHDQYYNNIKFSISVKDFHQEIFEEKEFKTFKSLIEKQYKGLVIADATTETLTLTEPTKYCSKCNDRLNTSLGVYFDQNESKYYCADCEVTLNRIDQLIIHETNLILVKYKKERIDILNEVCLFSYELYINSEKPLNENDCINCCICKETLNGDNIVWFSLIHLFNDENNEENLIICNRRCFPILNQNQLHKFDPLEVKRVIANCLNPEYLIFRKIILPSTGY